MSSQVSIQAKPVFHLGVNEPERLGEGLVMLQFLGQANDLVIVPQNVVRLRARKNEHSQKCFRLFHRTTARGDMSQKAPRKICAKICGISVKIHCLANYTKPPKKV